MRELRLPRLKRTIEAFRASTGDAYLLRGGGAPDLVLEDISPADWRCLQALDGTRTLDEAIAIASRDAAPSAGPAALREAVSALHRAGLIEDAALDAELIPDARARQRYDRQLSYFGDMAAARPRADCHRRLAASRIALIGVGGLGGWIAYALACAGVGAITAADGDTVELSNLSRQILYGENDVGRSKVEAAGDALRRFNSALVFDGHRRRLECAGDVVAFARGADFIIDAGDWPAHDLGRWVNQAAFELGIPHIGASQWPPLARVGPAVLPGVTACLECQELAQTAGFPLFQELVDHRRTRPSAAAVFGPVCGVTATLLATDVLHHLAGIGDMATAGAALMIDLRTLETTRVALERHPRCGRCFSRAPMVKNH